MYYIFMLVSGEKFGAFIVPTGVGASIGGYAGDASCWARKFSQVSKLIVNPNVVNAASFSGINEKMFYVEGYSIDEFFKGNLKLKPSESNSVGIIFDKAIPQDVLNVHINTLNAVKTVYGIDIIGYEITPYEVGVEFYVDETGVSVGRVNNPETLNVAAKKLIDNGANAIAIVCLFEDTNDDDNYSNGIGVDSVGGVEAIISHYISKELKVPCAHSPAFRDYQIYPNIVNPKASAEYVTPTFLPCILLGLTNAPLLDGDIGIEMLDYLVMPYNSLGSIPVFEALKRGIKVFAVKENSTVLDVSNENLHKNKNIVIVETYAECLELVKSF